ncbi:hypothetical protein Purlil1_2576 [Purpureocillium lilacinum]|uniref:Uncharacterized protein n=1 Tax=Purpureocillium lilacinum TaxID=33203 RepID=A0ABR0CAK3_PURLI|nr:hypothetical protein Purlil1_2576 [Purpureocillium lilacinum]
MQVPAFAWQAVAASQAPDPPRLTGREHPAAESSGKQTENQQNSQAHIARQAPARQLRRPSRSLAQISAARRPTRAHTAPARQYKASRRPADF